MSLMKCYGFLLIIFHVSHLGCNKQPGGVVGPKATAVAGTYNKRKTTVDYYYCGHPGAPGSPGLPGQPGVQGIQGVQGAQGPTGIAGMPGNNGIKGDKGDQGVRGYKGRKGESGHLRATNHPSLNVAFSVTMDNDLEPSQEYRVVKFNVVLLNNNGVYCTETGIFTAPVNGTYVIGFSGVSHHGQNILLHLVRDGKRMLSAFDNSGCACCDDVGSGCAGSASNTGVLLLDAGDQLWIELPDQHSMHNAPYHNYASFYGYLIHQIVVV